MVKVKVCKKQRQRRRQFKGSHSHKAQTRPGTAGVSRGVGRASQNACEIFPQAACIPQARSKVIGPGRAVRAQPKGVARRNHACMLWLLCA